MFSCLNLQYILVWSHLSILAFVCIMQGLLCLWSRYNHKVTKYDQLSRCCVHNQSNAPLVCITQQCCIYFLTKCESLCGLCVWVSGCTCFSHQPVWHGITLTCPLMQAESYSGTMPVLTSSCCSLPLTSPFLFLYFLFSSSYHPFLLLLATLLLLFLHPAAPPVKSQNGDATESTASL